MALLFMDGFDAGTTAMRWVNGASSTSSTSSRFSVGRSASISNNLLIRDFTASTQVFIGYACTVTAQDAAIREYISLYGDTGATLHLTLGYNNSTLTLYRGALGGTVLASYNAVFAPNTWYYFEVSATIADTGGTCIVKLNGATVINFTGDTKNAGTNTTIDRVGLGVNGGYTAIYDDVYICDSTGPAPYNTFLGEVRVFTQTPSGAGSSTQFTPSSGANYTTVDELPYSATDYVSSGTVGNRDTYALTDLPATAGNILAVQANAVAKKTDAASVSIKTAIVSGGTVYYGPTGSLGASDNTFTDLRTINPATSTAWTATSVNGLEAGAEIA